MPRPSSPLDQPRCDECGAYGEWHDGEQAYLCEWCEPEPDEVDLGELDQLEVQS